jgi:hypothetical protein
VSIRTTLRPEPLDRASNGCSAVSSPRAEHSAPSGRRGKGRGCAHPRNPPRCPSLRRSQRTRAANSSSPTPPGPNTYSTLKGDSSEASADRKSSLSATRPTNVRWRSELRRSDLPGDTELSLQATRCNRRGPIMLHPGAPGNAYSGLRRSRTPSVSYQLSAVSYRQEWRADR